MWNHSVNKVIDWFKDINHAWSACTLKPEQSVVCDSSVACSLHLKMVTVCVCVCVYIPIV